MLSYSNTQTMDDAAATDCSTTSSPSCTVSSATHAAVVTLTTGVLRG